MLGSTRINRVVVSRCEPRRSAALSGKLQKGDVLLEVRRVKDGQWVSYQVGSKTCKEVKELLTGQVGEVFGLTVRRTLPQSSQDPLFGGDSEQGVGGRRPSMTQSGSEQEIDVILRNKYPEPEEGQAPTTSQQHCQPLSPGDTVVVGQALLVTVEQYWDRYASFSRSLLPIY